jgi:hypothetical protein
MQANLLSPVANSITVIKNRTEHLSPTNKSFCLSLTPIKTHDYFKIGIFKGTGPSDAQSKTPSPQECPGIPLSPDVMVEKENVDASWLELECESSSGRDGFVDTYNAIFPHQKIIIRN